VEIRSALTYTDASHALLQKIDLSITPQALGRLTTTGSSSPSRRKLSPAMGLPG